MNFDINDLYGVYQVQKIDTYESGELIQDPVIDGMFTFTRDHLLSVVNGSRDSVMAYTGRFEVLENALHIHVKTCNRRDLENTTIQRKIDYLDKEQLILSMISKDGAMSAIIHWKKLLSL